METFDELYKRNFLKDISSHSELLVYDWSNGGDIELVIEDIERIGIYFSQWAMIPSIKRKGSVILNIYLFPLDFDSYEKESSKMRDWRFFRTEADWCEIRMKYTDDRHITHSYVDLPLFHCPDLVIQPEDSMVRDRIYEEV